MEPRNKISSYRDLLVWQKSMDLVVEVYKATKRFPVEEQYVLTSQVKRCAVSIPSNIAEGYRRSTRKDYKNFLHNSFASGAELETQLEIALRLGFLTQEQFKKISNDLTEIQKILNVLIRKLS